MKQGNELSWPQVVMAANAPMMTKAALVDGRTDVGVLPTGQVVGEIDELPDGGRADHPGRGRGRPRPRPPRCPRGALSLPDHGPTRPSCPLARHGQDVHRVDTDRWNYPIAHCFPVQGRPYFSPHRIPQRPRNRHERNTDRPRARIRSVGRPCSVLRQGPRRSDARSSRPDLPLASHGPGLPDEHHRCRRGHRLRMGRQARVGRLHARGERRAAAHGSGRLRGRRTGLRRHHQCRGRAPRWSQPLHPRRPVRGT